MTDDLQLAELRDRIAALEQQQELLLYTASHDLRTPVMTVLGFTDMLLADLPDNSNNQQRQYLERIRSATQRQSLLIQDLQQIAQLSRQPLQLEAVDLTAVARRYLSTTPQSANRSVMAFPAISLDATPTVTADSDLMTVALHALLSNAVKLAGTLNTATVKFGSKLEGDQNIFYVQDSGAGFDLGQDQSLLALFRRLQAGSELAGTGIALLTAMVIIHRHGGKLWIESASNHGTNVYFTI